MAKIALRDQIRTARHRLPVAELGSLGRDLADVVTAHPEVRRAATVAAYVSVGTEPGTGALLDALAALGKRVILPVVLPDMDLDWGTWRGATSLAPARYGLLEPVDRLGRRRDRHRRRGARARARRLGDRAPGSARAVAATTGRSAGSRSAPRWCACLYDDEVGLDVPVDDHDRPVTAAATPTRWVRLR